MTSSDSDDASPLRRIFIVAAALAIAATLGVILAALTFPGGRELALHWYLIVIGVIAVAAVIRTMGTRYPVQWQSSPWPATLQPAAPLEHPARLRAIGRMVARAGWDPVRFQLELRLVLRAIAAQRLATYRTIDIAANAEAARAALGERAWILLAPVDLKQAESNDGIAMSDLRHTVEALEKLDVIPHD